VLYDLLGRVGAGAHGDRGSFEYYVKYAGFGMFPWSGLVPPALWASAEARHGRDKSERFTLLVAMWGLVTFAFFTATTTKFHHYIFPLVVPCALLIGKYLDALLDDPKKKIAPAVAFICVVACALIGRDLVQEPWQLIDLFTYHYKSYKPEYYFPSDDEWRVGLSIACFGAAFIIAAGALWDTMRPAPSGDAQSWLGRIVLGKRTASEGFVVAYLAAAILFAIFAVQVHFNRASQHWSQRELFETYYSMRKADEPIMAFQMDWKGETFYGKNQDIQIKKSGADLKKAVEQRPGRSFVIVQTDRFVSLKTALGKDYESRIKVVDRSNQKWYLFLIDQ
jgi:4-amino-4-deoxy-L-arabinose transferase-like glycosyltransferase